MIKEHIIKIIVQVIIIFIFIGIFFFTYASTIERNIVEKQVKEIVNDLLGDAKKVVPPNLLKLANNYIQVTNPVSSLSKEDDDVNKNNKMVIYKAIKGISIITVIGIIVIIILSLIGSNPINYISIVKDTSLILLFVGIVETSFLTFFVQNYRTVDSNFVKYKTIKTISNYV